MKGLSGRRRSQGTCRFFFIDNISAFRGVAFVNKSCSTWNLTPCAVYAGYMYMYSQRRYGRLLRHCNHDSHIFLPPLPSHFWSSSFGVLPGYIGTAKRLVPVPLIIFASPTLSFPRDHPDLTKVCGTTGA